MQRRRVRALLGHDPATAGGLMSPEFICVYSQATLPEVFERIRGSRASAEAIASIYVMNTRRRLHGAITLADLVRAEDGQTDRRDRGRRAALSAPTPISRRSRG